MDVAPFSPVRAAESLEPVALDVHGHRVAAVVIGDAIAEAVLSPSGVERSLASDVVAAAGNPFPPDLCDETLIALVVTHGAVPGTRPVDVVEFAASAGGGIDGEHVRVLAWCARSWHDRLGLIATKCAIIRVRGESMEPPLPDRCSILFDRDRREGGIYFVRAGDGLIVKRAARRRRDWELASDCVAQATKRAMRGRIAALHSPMKPFQVSMDRYASTIASSAMERIPVSATTPECSYAYLHSTNSFLFRNRAVSMPDAASGKMAGATASGMRADIRFCVSSDRALNSLRRSCSLSGGATRSLRCHAFRAISTARDSSIGVARNAPSLHTPATLLASISFTIHRSAFARFIMRSGLLFQKLLMSFRCAAYGAC